LLVALARRRSRQTAEPEQRVGMTRLPDEAVLLDFDDTLSGPSHRAIGCVSFALQSLDLPLASVGRIRGTIGLSPTGTLTHPGGDDAAALGQGSCRQSVQRAGEVVTDVARLFQSAPPAMAGPREEGRGLETASAESSHRIQSLLDCPCAGGSSLDAGTAARAEVPFVGVLAGVTSSEALDLCQEPGCV